MYGICCMPFWLRNLLVKNSFFKSFPPKNAQIVNLKNCNLDWIQESTQDVDFMDS